ncbi:hypothetical protein P175DRAFT_0498032 [Aspergillus ochraceoroseus IBT 24754]|uniref:Uncharacterized protein n=1 Tax=Aspergillus ochraceoroseus IBT 24754 TaxID=1392256 RepID=A0A2T5M8S3_9EURO|nr:uncharacterized protein P175DRAFT_0498032 [Aspergillus ochraceoroseus IBT 24754]PTU24927.1 hypothetical protein P175DRAFT_0498032 [Aspergillus ochraceoroseus IBT 24754]
MTRDPLPACFPGQLFPSLKIFGGSLIFFALVYRFSLGALSILLSPFTCEIRSSSLGAGTRTSHF